MTENSKTVFQNIDASVEAIDSGLGITEVESLFGIWQNFEPTVTPFPISR